MITHGQNLSELIQFQKGETVLVSDSVETDGRFVLYQAIVSSMTDFKNVLWWSCTANTEKLIVSGLRKIGWSSHSGSLLVHSIPSAIEEQILSTGDRDHHIVNENAIMEQIAKDVKVWLEENGLNGVVVVDDVTSLVGLLGPRIAYNLVLSFRQLALRHNFPLVLRCSSDSDNLESEEWFGAGGKVQSCSSSNTETVFEHGLVELADRFIDVTSLASGYSKEAHGRLTITADDSTQNHYNFVLTDQDVRVFRIQQS